MRQLALKKLPRDIVVEDGKKKRKEKTGNLSLLFHFAFFPLEIHPRHPIPPPAFLRLPLVVRVLSLYLAISDFPLAAFLPFLFAVPAEINDSEILIQWQGCQALGSRLSFFHALRLPGSPPRATHPVFLLHVSSAKPKGSFFSAEIHEDEKGADPSRVIKTGNDCLVAIMTMQKGKEN